MRSRFFILELCDLCALERRARAERLVYCPERSRIMFFLSFFCAVGRFCLSAIKSVFCRGAVGAVIGGGGILYAVGRCGIWGAVVWYIGGGGMVYRGRWCSIWGGAV